MKTTKIIAALGTLALVVATVPAADAQRAAPHGGSGIALQQAQGGQTGLVGEPGQMGEAGAQAQETADQRRRRIRTDQDLARRLQDCADDAAGIQRRARRLSLSAGGEGFGATRARRQGDRISGGVQTMLRQHDRLIQGLSNEQQLYLRDETRSLQRTRDRIQDQLHDMTVAIGARRPDSRRIGECAGELAGEMERLQKQYRRMTAALGVGPE